MPIIQIQSLPPKTEENFTEILSKASLVVADTLEVPARSVWATWQEISPHGYVEGDVSAEFLPKDTHPPIVRLLLFEGRPREKLEAALLALADSITESLDLAPGSVFVHYQEIPPGHVFTGGEIRR